MISKYPELHPMSDEDVDMIWECFGLSPEDLLDMKTGAPSRFDDVNVPLNYSNAL